MKRIHLFVLIVKKKRLVFVQCVFLLISLGTAYYITLVRQLPSMTILDHRYHLQPLRFLFITFSLYAFLLFLWYLFSLLDRKHFEVPFQSALQRNLPAFCPLAIFLLTPTLLKFYISREDLATRLTVLAALALAGFIYLKAAYLITLLREKGVFANIIKKISKIPLKKRILILFLIAFIVYNTCTVILVINDVTFSGDEPYYLLSTHSLYQDRDINVANNYNNKDYFHFYSQKDNPRLKLPKYARKGLKGRSYLYPVNLPGISVLMLPNYWLSQQFEGKTQTFILKSSLSIWAALLGVQLYLLAGHLWKNEKISLILWFFFSFISPVLFYAIHLYPEIPIAFFSLLIYRKVVSSSSLSPLHILFFGFLLSLFPWFGLKYNLFLWPLLLISVYFLLTKQRVRWNVCWLFLFPLISMCLFHLYLYQIYGTFHPFAVYEGVLNPEKMEGFKASILNYPLSSRVETLLDYFLDQRDGLLLYSPFYLFFIMGFVEIFRRSKKHLLLLFCLSVPFLLNYAFFTHRQGYCPQGRILASLTWMGAVLTGYFLAYNQKRIFAGLFWAFGAASLILTLVLLRHPSFLYQPTTHDFTDRAGALFVHLSNMYIFIPKYLPSFIKVNNLGYAPNYVWILAILGIFFMYIFLKKDIRIKPAGRVFLTGLLLGLFFFLWVLFPRVILYPTWTVRYTPQKALGFYLYPMGPGVVAKKTAEFYLHREGRYKILFSSRRSLERIRLVFGSEKGEYDIQIDSFDIPALKERTSFEQKEYLLKPETAYPFKRLYLYEINLDIQKHTPENMLVDPYFVQIIPD